MDYKVLSSRFHRVDGSDFAQSRRGSLVPEVYHISRDFEERVSNLDNPKYEGPYKSQSSHVNSEDQEATLLLEIARARRDVCHAQRFLAECLNQENKSLCELHQFKARKFAELVDQADLSIGRIRAAFNSHGLAPQFPDVNTSTSSHSQDEDGECALNVVFVSLMTDWYQGTMFECVTGRLVAIKLD